MLSHSSKAILYDAIMSAAFLDIILLHFSCFGDGILSSWPNYWVEVDGASKMLFRHDAASLTRISRSERLGGTICSMPENEKKVA